MVNHPNRNKPRARFMFTVNGPRLSGVIYVTAPCSYGDHATAAELAHATRLAAERSGDAAPAFVRIA